MRLLRKEHSMSGKPSFQTRKLLDVMAKAQTDRISLRLPDGTSREFGQGTLVCEGKVNNWNVFDRLLTRGDIGLAETYIDGSLELDRPDQMVAWACRNEKTLKKAIYGVAISLVLDRLRHLGRRNTVEQAKKNIASHYDLGNEFYKLWLDPTLAYSSAIYSSESQTLEDAQIAKFERILNQASVKPGDHILEIGCGWGGFFSYAVRTRGCRVTAVTISSKQFEACQKRITSEGLGDSVTVLLQDYRDIQGQFDQVVSIEMIEAVGAAYWMSYFQKIRASLKSSGTAVIQGITIREDLFDRYKSGTDFIQQYVFPGGFLPTQSTFSQFGNITGMGLKELYAFPSSYERTLQDWRKKFVEVRKDVSGLGFGDEFFRLWEFYLAYCEGAFRADRIGVAHFTLTPIAS
jgi:cyclopropane-fatty-acyl-phospholipid synthase